MIFAVLASKLSSQRWKIIGSGRGPEAFSRAKCSNHPLLYSGQSTDCPDHLGGGLELMENVRGWNAFVTICGTALDMGGTVPVVTALTICASSCTKFGIAATNGTVCCTKVGILVGVCTMGAELMGAGLSLESVIEWENRSSISATFLSNSTLGAKAA